MKVYVALFKHGFGADYAPGHRVRVPETPAETAQVAPMAANKHFADWYGISATDAKAKLMIWVRKIRKRGPGFEFKLLNEGTGQPIDVDVAAEAAAASAPAAAAGK